MAPGYDFGAVVGIKFLYCSEQTAERGWRRSTGGQLPSGLNWSSSPGCPTPLPASAAIPFNSFATLGTVLPNTENSTGMKLIALQTGVCNAFMRQSNPCLNTVQYSTSTHKSRCGNVAQKAGSMEIKKVFD